MPYDKLGPASRSPMPVGTVSQGIRNSTATTISAPITNPTLTNEGTELNLYAMSRSRSERERLYPQSSKSLARSPYMSASNSTATLYSDGSSSSTSFTTITDSSRLRRSEGSSLDKRSPNMSDFGSLPPSSPPTSYNMFHATVRPTSVTSSRSESNRASKYATSLAASESMQSHYSHASHIFHHHKQGTQDDFDFPRPSDEDVEALFEQVRLKRDLGDLPPLSVEQKWQMVYNDEQLRWREEKKREEVTKKQLDTGQTPASYAQDSPEWYLKKFLDQSITPKQAAGLLVTLRTGPMRFAFNERPMCLQ